MRELLVATKNSGKFREISEALNGLGLSLVFLGDFLKASKIDDSDFVEDGKTFEENAYRKAKYYFEKTGIMSLADDSGIIVEALKEELGVKTRRWGAGENVSDTEWVEYFLKKMEGVKNRKAKFVCCACICGDGFNERFLGESFGVITEKLMAEIIPGIPLSSCFLPDGSDKVYAALSASEKNKISHRGKAMGCVREFFLFRNRKNTLKYI